MRRLSPGHAGRLSASDRGSDQHGDLSHGTNRAAGAQSNRRNLEPGEPIRCIDRLDAIKQRGRKPELASRDANSGKSAAETSSLVGVSQATVERAHKVLRDGDARAAVESGEKSINAASKDVRPGRRLYRYEGRVD